MYGSNVSNYWMIDIYWIYTDSFPALKKDFKDITPSCKYSSKVTELIHSPLQFLNMNNNA